MTSSCLVLIKTQNWQHVVIFNIFNTFSMPTPCWCRWHSVCEMIELIGWSCTKMTNYDFDYNKFQWGKTRKVKTSPLNSKRRDGWISGAGCHEIWSNGMWLLLPTLPCRKKAEIWNKSKTFVGATQSEVFLWTVVLDESVRTKKHFPLCSFMLIFQQMP